MWNHGPYLSPPAFLLQSSPSGIHRQPSGRAAPLSETSMSRLSRTFPTSAFNMNIRFLCSSIIASSPLLCCAATRLDFELQVVVERMQPLSRFFIDDAQTIAISDIRPHLVFLPPCGSPAAIPSYTHLIDAVGLAGSLATQN